VTIVNIRWVSVIQKGICSCAVTIGESVCAIRRITFDIYEIERAIASELPSLQHAR
jgi:hypothetical protein